MTDRERLASMTRADDRFRASEGSGPWLHPHRRQPERRSPGAWLWALAVLAVAIALTARLAIGAPVTPAPPTGPGFETCMTRGC